MNMTSSKPYLIRAIHEWISDNNTTPYIAVDTAISGTSVPQEHIKDGRIVLNISLISTGDLVIGNDALEFKARFKGVSHNIYIPIAAVMVIYAKENNQGMSFPPEEFDTDSEKNSAKQLSARTPPKGKAKLQLVTDD